MGIMKLILILLVTILGVVNAGPYWDQCKRNEDCQSGEICISKIGPWRSLCVPQDCRYQKDMCRSDEECVLYSHDCFGQGASGLWAGQSARFSPCRYVCRSKPQPFPEGHQCETSSDCKFREEVCVNVNGINQCKFEL